MSPPAIPVPARPALRLNALATALLAILALAAALRAYHLGTASLWTDELFTRFYPKAGLRFLWGEGRLIEPTPPLYYSLIALWERAFGDSALSLRLPSLLGSLLQIGLAVALARELFARPAAAVLAGLLLALAPTHIAFAQEARSYAFQGAALGMALLGFARFLRDPASRAALATYGIGAALALYLHPTSVLAVASMNAAALAAMPGSGRLLDRAGLRRWIVANALVALVWAPLVPGLLSSEAADATSWIEPISRWLIEREVGIALFGPALSQHAIPLFEIAAVLLFLLFLIPPWRPGRRAFLVLVVVPALFLLLMIGLSLKKPVFISRILAWLWIPFAVALGDLLTRRPKVLAAAALACFAAGAGLYVASVDHLREDWKGFLARLPDLSPPTLVVVAPHTPPAAIAVYAPQAAPAARLGGHGPPIVETMVIPPMLGVKTIEFADLAQAIQAGRPVWLITRRGELIWMQEQIASLPPPKLIIQDGEGNNPPIRAFRW